jgi:hypothetical protein
MVIVTDVIGNNWIVFTVNPLILYVYKQWCYENFESNNWTCTSNGMFYFKNINDAMLFKLVWL